MDGNSSGYPYHCNAIGPPLGFIHVETEKFLSGTPRHSYLRILMPIITKQAKRSSSTTNHCTALRNAAIFLNLDIELTSNREMIGSLHAAHTLSTVLLTAKMAPVENKDGQPNTLPRISAPHSFPHSKRGNTSDPSDGLDSPLVF